MRGDANAASSQAGAPLSEEKEAVREHFTRYCYHVDRSEHDEFANLFTEDCVWDGGALGRQEGRTAVRELSVMISKNFDEGSLRHQLINPIVSVDGDTAHVTSYFNVLQGKPGSPIAIFATGTYDVDCVKQDGKWKIKTLKLVPAFMG